MKYFSVDSIQFNVENHSKTNASYHKILNVKVGHIFSNAINEQSQYVRLDRKVNHIVVGTIEEMCYLVQQRQFTLKIIC